MCGPCEARNRCVDHVRRGTHVWTTWGAEQMYMWLLVRVTLLTGQDMISSGGKVSWYKSNFQLCTSKELSQCHVVVIKLWRIHMLCVVELVVRHKGTCAVRLPWLPHPSHVDQSTSSTYLSWYTNQLPWRLLVVGKCIKGRHSWWMCIGRLSRNISWEVWPATCWRQ